MWESLKRLRGPRASKRGCVCILHSHDLGSGVCPATSQLVKGLNDKERVGNKSWGMKNPVKIPKKKREEKPMQ